MAARPHDDRKLVETLDLEHQVWRALVDGDAAADEALLDPDFIGLYPSGRATRADHSGQLSAGPTVVTYEITDPVVSELAPGVRLLTYTADYRRPGRDTDDRMHVSSIWVDDGHGWRNVFSQDTDATN